jgi:apolipoprotein N-acyltransferase
VFWRSDSSWKTLVLEGDVVLFIVYLFLFGLHFLHFFWVCSSGGDSGGFELWVTSGV